MCWQDIEIGRIAGGSMRQVTLSPLAKPLVGYSPNRVFLAFQLASTGTSNYLSTNPSLAAGGGFGLTSPNLIWELDIRYYGSLVQQPWYGISTGTGVINVIEVVAPDLPRG